MRARKGLACAVNRATTVCPVVLLIALALAGCSVDAGIHRQTTGPSVIPLPAQITVSAAPYQTIEDALKAEANIDLLHDEASPDAVVRARENGLDLAEPRDRIGRELAFLRQSAILTDTVPAVNQLLFLDFHAQLAGLP